METFIGLFELEDTLESGVLAENSSHVPVNADSAPTFRVYGPEGLQPSSSGSLTFKDSGDITDVSAEDPAEITSASHGLTTGTRVTITGITGTGSITDANTTTTVTVTGTDTFTLDGVDTTGGTYSSGGAWNVTGLYSVSVDLTSDNSYESGQSYFILVSYQISGTDFSKLLHFQVA